MQPHLLFSAFIFLAAVCIVVPLSSRFKLGSVLGYLAAGILIGPYGLKLISNANQVMHFAEFGVVMMLFLIGLELEPAILWRMRKSIIGMGSGQVIVSSAAFTGIGVLLGYDWHLTLAVGMAISLSSTALVLQMLQEKDLMQTQAGESSFAVLLFQDVAVIPILILLPLLAMNNSAVVTSHHVDWLSNVPGWSHALIILGVITLLIVVGHYFSYYMFRFIAKTNLREVFTATSLALVVGITLLMEHVGVSPALGAFIAGVVLANSEYKHTLETDIQPFKGLLLGLFFISIGMGMKFSLLVAYPFYLLGLVALLIIVKMLVLLVLGRVFGLAKSQNALFALALAQGGEFAFVLFQYANNLRILTTEQTNFLTLAVAISMAVTPFIMVLNERFIVSRFMSELPNHEYDMPANDRPVIIVGYGRFGQIIGRFLNVQGIKTTILENDPDQVEAVRRFGSKSFFGDPSRLGLLKSAGAEQAKLLVIAVDDADKCLQIVKMAKEEFPNLKIFARARNRRHAYELHKAGADYFRRETFDAALAMAQEAIQVFGVEPNVAKQRAEKFLHHDEATLKKSFAFFEKEPELIDFAKRANLELERILQSDLQDENT